MSDKSLFLNLQFDDSMYGFLTYFLVLGSIVLLALLLYFILSRIARKFITVTISEKYKKSFLPLYLEEADLFRSILLFFPPTFTIYLLPIAESSLGQTSHLLWLVLLTKKVLTSYILVLFALLLNKCIDLGEKVYNRYPISKKWPIRSYIQFLKVVSFLIFSIIIISSLLDKSPLAFFTGLGAMMAIVSLVFKDSILSFISSIQLAASNMVQVGQWIEIPGKDISGTVIEMSLNTVKVENFDKTISTIPPYFLTTNIIKNWQGMYDSGGRRFKRSLPFDMNTIRSLDKALLSQLQKIPLLSEYIKENHENLLATGTNLQLFRIYAQRFLDADARIHENNFTCLVRELAPSSINGTQVEIYAFTRTVNWKDYESISADVMDHLAAKSSEFSLKFLQRASL